MSFLGKFALLLIANSVGIYAAVKLVDGFSVPLEPVAFIKVSLVLALIHLRIRPVIKFVLSPVIFLTLGLGILVVNALVLYLLDIALPEVVVSGLYALAYATLIVSIANFIVYSLGKRAVRKSD